VKYDHVESSPNRIQPITISVGTPQ
jgi:hypothetical protein